MSLIRKSNQLAISEEFASSPFTALLAFAPNTREMPVPAKAQCIVEVLTCMKQIEDQCKNGVAKDYALGIGNAFGAVLAVAGANAAAPALIPFVGIPAAAGAIGSLFFCAKEKSKLERLESRCRLIRLAIATTEAKYWAAIWHLAGTSVFGMCVEYAAEGWVDNDDIFRYQGDSPIVKATDTLSQMKAWTYDEALDRIEVLAQNEHEQSDSLVSASAAKAELSPVIATMAPTKIQEPIIKLQERLPKTSENYFLPTSPAIQPEPIREEEAKDIIDLILACVNSLSFIGGQRCGKSLLMAIASRIGIQRGKFKSVFVISSLAKMGEDDHYWQHCSVKTFYDLAVIVDKTPYYEKFLDTIREFRKTTNASNPQLLVIDEFPFLCERLEDDIRDKNDVAIELMKEIADLGSVVASGGAKRGWYVWLGSPQGNVGEMGRGGKMMKKLTLCYCAIAPGVTVNSNGVNVEWDSNLFAATSRNFPALKEPVRGIAHDLSERIVFFNAKWYAKTRHELATVTPSQDQSAAIAAIATEDALNSEERESLNTVVAMTRKTQAGIIIEKLEASSAASLSDFIVRELRQNDKQNEIRQGIIAILRKFERFDLLKKFNES